MYVLANISHLTPGFFDSFLQLWWEATNDWGARAVVATTPIFAALATLWFVKGLLLWTLMKHQREHMIWNAMIRLIAILLLFALFAGAPIWTTTIVGVFIDMAAAFGGFNSVSPSGIFDVSATLHESIWTTGGLWVDILSLGTATVYRLIASLILWAATLMISFRLFGLFVELYTWVPAGTVLLSLAPHDATRGIADGYLSAFLNLCARFFGTLTVYAVGVVIIRDFIADVEAFEFESVLSLFVTCGVVAAFAMVVWTTGDRLANRLSLDNRISIGRLARIFI